jgi:hypothetical protein
MALVTPLWVAGPVRADHVVVRSTMVACPSEHVSPTEVTGYVDVVGSPFEREVNCLSDYQLVKGRTDGRYEPGAPVLRRHMALFLSRLVSAAKVTLPTADAGFTDLGGLDGTARAAVHAVAGLGISGGVDARHFVPDAPVTRGQMATFLARTHEAIGGAQFPEGENAFDDDEGGVHHSGINAIAATGIGVGVSDREFAPFREVTRGQMAAFLARLLDVEVQGGHVASAYAPAPDPGASPVPTEPPAPDPGASPVPTEPPGPDPGASPVPTEPPGPVRFASAGPLCTVLGTEGDDVLTGTAGPDVLCGFGGDDVLDGAGGDDVLDGGHGSDELAGSAGDDDLDGGEGPDVLDGGPGTNWCVPAPEDVLSLCVYDLLAPTVESVTVSPDPVEVSADDVPVTVRAHVRDDTGVAQVAFVAHGQAGYGPELMVSRLVSGTVRDGWWEVVGTAPRFHPAGLFDIAVSPTDRVGRQEDVWFADALDIRTSTPDLQLPQVISASLSGSLPLDVRSAPGTVSVQARITDDLSGTTPPFACLRAPDTSSQLGGHECTHLELRSGSVLDGTWRAEIPVAEGAVGGSWNFSITVTDRAHQTRGPSWVGEQLYLAETDGGTRALDFYRQLPGGAGTFSVLGSTSDTVAPSVTEVTVEPAVVDTLHGPARVAVSLHVVDPGGVTLVQVQLRPLVRDAGLPTLDLEGNNVPTEGTGTDGWWRFDFTVPQGTPPGVYEVFAWATDAQHWVDFGPAASPEVLAGQAQPLPAPASVTVAPSDPPPFTGLPLPDASYAGLAAFSGHA